METGGVADPGTAEKFEEAYYRKYWAVLEDFSRRSGWPGEKLATAYGAWQILGENLARYHGLRYEDLEGFLTDLRKQRAVARAEFYRQLQLVISRRGLAWPVYLFSMWNAGINYNADYARAILSRLKGK